MVHVSKERAWTAEYNQEKRKRQTEADRVEALMSQRDHSKQSLKEYEDKQESIHRQDLQSHEKTLADRESIHREDVKLEEQMLADSYEAALATARDEADILRVVPSVAKINEKIKIEVNNENEK